MGLLLLFGISTQVHASLFPDDSITSVLRNETGTDTLNQFWLATSTRTILAIASQQTTAKETTVYCGSNASGTAPAIYDTMISSNTSFQRLMMAKCTSAIYVDNYRTTFLGMTYVNRDMATISASSTQQVNFTTSTTTPFYTKDTGALYFGIAIIITLLFFHFITFIYTNLKRKYKI